MLVEGVTKKDVSSSFLETTHSENILDRNNPILAVVLVYLLMIGVLEVGQVLHRHWKRGALDLSKDLPGHDWGPWT